MPMPLVKLGYLFIRTIAKPISGAIKQQAKAHPKFREACVRFAQLYHRVEVRMRRRLAARRGEETTAIAAAVSPLDEQKAIELGAAFIGESIVFGVAGILLVAESARSYRAEQVRRRMIEEKLEQLSEHVTLLAKQQQEMQAHLATIAKNKGQEE